jgi:aldehyde dehydrogenase (NAD+)
MESDMSNDLKFYINGEWVQSDSNELIDVINPANEEIIGQVTAGTKEDIDDAVSAASEAFISFSKSTQEERIELLKKIIQE